VANSRIEDGQRTEAELDKRQYAMPYGLEGLASHCPYVGGLSTYGFKGVEAEGEKMSSPPTLL